MSIVCGPTDADFYIGHGSPYQYIYKTGYIWQKPATGSGQATWTPFPYFGSSMSSDGNWFIGNATTFRNFTSAEFS